MSNRGESDTVILGPLQSYFTFAPDQVDYGGLAIDQFELLPIVDPAGHSVSAYFKRRADNPYLVIFFHGNTGNITRFPAHHRILDSSGFSYVTFDYPGYGKTPGEPTEQSLYESAAAVYGYCTGRLGFKSENIALFGLSLGAAVAIELGSRVPYRCLIAEAPFTSSRAMAKRLFPRLPLWRVVRNRFVNEEKVARLSGPILFVHGIEDRTTPVEFSDQLYAAAREPKKIVRVAGAGHSSLPGKLGAGYVELVRGFVVNPGAVR